MQTTLPRHVQDYVKEANEKLKAKDLTLVYDGFHDNDHCFGVYNKDNFLEDFIGINEFEEFIHPLKKFVDRIEDVY